MSAPGGDRASVSGAPAVAPAPEFAREELSRSLPPLQVASLALGCIIGFGAFVLPGEFLGMAGPMGAALGIALGGAAVVTIAQSYGLMVRTLPVAGGEFAYSYYTAGRYHAFVCGWLLTLGYLCIVPLNASALPILGKFLAPSLFARGYLYSVAGFDVYVGELILASAAIVGIGYFQQRGVSATGRLQFLMTSVLVTAVVLIGGDTLLSPEARVANMEPLFPPGRNAVAAVLSLVAIAPWLYVGWGTLPQASEEFAFSPRKARMLMTAAISAGALMYVIVTLSTAAVMPWQELLARRTGWATGETVRLSLGRPGLVFLGVAVTMAILTGINGFFMAASRLLFSMGRARVLPAWFGRVHETHRTPHHAILFVGVVSLVAPWMGREVILWIVNMSAVGTAVGYLYTSVAAFVLARRMAGQKGMAGQAVVSAVGIVLSLGFLVLLLVPGMPGFMAMQSWIALGAWILLGGIFFLTKVRAYRAVPDSELRTLILGDNGGAAIAAESPCEMAVETGGVGR